MQGGTSWTLAEGTKLIKACAAPGHLAFCTCPTVRRQQVRPWTCYRGYYLLWPKNTDLFTRNWEALLERGIWGKLWLTCCYHCQKSDGLIIRHFIFFILYTIVPCKTQGEALQWKSKNFSQTFSGILWLQHLTLTNSLKERWERIGL